MAHRYSWEVVFELAVSEADLVKTHAYVEAAETLIFVRGLEAQQLSVNGDREAERRSMESTLKGLLHLKTVKLGWPLTSEEVSLNGSTAR